MPTGRALVGIATTAVLLAGCSGAGGGTAPAPSPSATSSPASTPTIPDVRSAGSDGLVIRHKTADGDIKTLPVEDFPR
ncbi:MAG TPA: hypothetical protein VFP34_14880 [Microlunatus sp.]|nr:hypothetical protein [Microlunatus sp.]